MLSLTKMNRIDWLNEQVNQLIEKAMDDKFMTNITVSKVLHAKRLIKNFAYSTEDFFIILASINLLNASIKRPEYRNMLTYEELKGNASRIIHYLITLEANKYSMNFYINPIEHCAYFEVYNLQFSFHNIHINNTIQRFIDSGRNQIKAWRQIKLQRISGELFDLSIANKELSVSIR